MSYPQTFPEWWLAHNPHRDLETLEDVAHAAWRAAIESVGMHLDGDNLVAACVLQGWAWKLPLMQQTVLLCTLRGPDGMTKNSPAKTIVRFMRRAILHNARPLEQSDFMAEVGPHSFIDYVNEFFEDTDVYPTHFLLHLFHAAEILAYKHPAESERAKWDVFYRRACDSFHMNPEREAVLDERLAL
jgi:hypothetical protein